MLHAGTGRACRAGVSFCWRHSSLARCVEVKQTAGGMMRPIGQSRDWGTVLGAASAVRRCQDVEMKHWTGLYQVRDWDDRVRWYLVAEESRS